MIWIDIEDLSGTKLGSGPITTASDWELVREVDRPGTFTFAMPATDPKSALLQLKRVARCWGYEGGSVRLRGGGIINQIDLDVATGVPTWQVSGDTISHELTYRSVGDLRLVDEITAHPAEAFIVDDGAAIDAGDDVTGRYLSDQMLDNAPGDTDSYATLDDNMEYRWFLVKHPLPFKQVTFTLTALNTVGTLMYAKYWTADGEWADLTCEATTEVPWGAATWSLTWDPPADWTIRTGEAGYKILLKPNGCETGVQIADVAVVYEQPTATALATLMALAPAGWSLDTAHGYASIGAATELGDELLTNGDLEAGAGDAFTGWTTAGTDANDKVESTATAHSGSRAVKITATDFYAEPRLYQDVDVEPGRNYRLSLWGRGDGTRQGTFLVGVNGATTHRLIPPTGSGTAGTTYVAVHQLLTTPAGATSLRVQLNATWYTYASAAYWDLVSLRECLGGEVYRECDNESVLEMLTWLAEQTGEHWIESSAWRQVLWLRNDQRSSGLRAIRGRNTIGGESAPEIAYIRSIRETQNAYELCTRVYPSGGDAGDRRVTLADCTRAAPPGYALDKTAGCLIRTQAEVGGLRIDKRLPCPEVVAQTTAPEQVTMAANMLFDRSYAYLVRHSATSLDAAAGDMPRAYEIELEKCDRELLPGYTLRVVYDDWQAGVRSIHIDRDLWIQSSTVRVGPSGASTVRITASTIDARPLSERDLLLGLLKNQRAMMAYGAPG
jgi:hypothetical protein